MNWKKTVFKLNYTYLSCLKEAGCEAARLSPVLGVPVDVLEALVAADAQVLRSLAQVSVPMCRLAPNQIEAALAAANNGDHINAKALVVASGISEEGADCGIGR